MAGATRLVNLSSGETIAEVDTVELVRLQRLLGDGEAYHVLRLTPAALDDLAAADVAAELVDRLRAALADASSLLLGHMTPRPGAPWRITGTVCDPNDHPLPGLQVLAYDKDRAKRDDFLGCAFTDEEGFFELRYAAEDFKNEQAIIDFEGNPDLYLHLTDLALGLTKRTETKREAEREEHFELKVSFSSRTKMLRPVVGYYWIEEDRLEDEVERLKDSIKASPADAQAHFLLGLCFLEMLKSALRKSAWELPEVRVDDDVLALAALQELEDVVSLDPTRELEVERYRKFVEELRSLAL